MADNNGRKQISPALRAAILERDGYRCVWCGREAVDGVKLEIDHITPVSEGGLTEEDNLRTLCFECNRGRSGLNLQQQGVMQMFRDNGSKERKRLASAGDNILKEKELDQYFEQVFGAPPPISTSLFEKHGLLSDYGLKSLFINPYQTGTCIRPISLRDKLKRWVREEVLRWHYN